MKTNLFAMNLGKRLFLPAVLAFSPFVLDAQIFNFPWTETFEDDSPTRSSWTQIHEANSVDWTFASSATTGSTGITAFSGSKFANFPTNSSFPDKTKLVSPPFNTASLTSPKLSFYLVNPQLNGHANWVRIYYRMSATDSWTLLMGFQPPFSSWYFFANIGMPPNIYQVAIECENSQGYSTLVDQVTISNDVLSTSEITNHSKSKINFYPNPVKNELNYTGREKIDEIFIYDLNGIKVKEQKINSLSGSIDVSALKNGVYIISAKKGEGTENFKIIKN